MAEHTLTGSEIGIHEQALVATVVDTVTFDTPTSSVEVTSDGAAAIYFTVDGSTPTVKGKNCFYIPAAPGVRVVPDERGAGETVVKLISAGTPVYSVARGV